MRPMAALLLLQGCRAYYPAAGGVAVRRTADLAAPRLAAPRVVVITGASSGLGLAATIALLDGARKKGYFVVAAVRDPERMEKVALENGISRNDYVAMKLELASLQSVKVPTPLNLTPLNLGRGWGVRVRVMRGG